MHESRELELKLDLDPAAARQLRDGGLQGIGADGGVRESLRSVYFDTKKLSLKRKGLSLRVRAQGGRRLQTMKGESVGRAGVFDRPEWNQEIDGDEPDLGKIGKTPFRSVLQTKRLRLKPVFTTEVDRTTWRIRSETAEIEVALDEGRVVAGDRTAPFAELELEIKSGSPSELFRLARSLGPGGLKIGVATKSERGYALAEGSTPTSVKAEPIALQPDASTADAFRLIAAACIRHFRLNEPLLIETRAVEALHQSRVALRRLRTALSLFKDVVADDEIERLKEGLRRISQQLGEARDLDVFLANQGLADDGPATEDKAELIERMQKDREEAYDRVIATLQGAPFQRLMLDFLAWVETGPWLSDEDPPSRSRRRKPIESFAVEVLERRRRKINKTARKLDRLNATDRHRVRIDTKKLRYATEFFTSLATSKKKQKRHKVLAKALEELQEHLGALNDLATGDKMAAGLQQGSGQVPDETSRSLQVRTGHVAGERSREIERSLTAANSAFREFKNAKPFWGSASAGAKRRA